MHKEISYNGSLGAKLTSKDISWCLEIHGTYRWSENFRKTCLKCQIRAILP